MNKVLFLQLLVSLFLFSCKKDEETKPEPDSQSLSQVEDNNDLKSESDQTNTDVTDAIGNFSSLNGGRLAVANAKKTICGCIIDSAQLGSRVLILNFDGTTPCGSPSRTRGGTIRVELVQSNSWAQAGARLKITHNNYKVTRLRDGKSWTINGDKYLNNVLGSNWFGFLAGTDSLLYRERSSNMNILFSGGATTTYSIARLTSWKIARKSGIADYIQFSAIVWTTRNAVTHHFI